MIKCPYSLSDDVPQDADELPAKCPVCGAMRTRRRYKVPPSRFYFAQHEPLIASSSKEGAHWEKIGGVWQIVRSKKRWLIAMERGNCTRSSRGLKL
jgi:hypothetical protein